MVNKCSSEGSEGYFQVCVGWVWWGVKSYYHVNLYNGQGLVVFDKKNLPLEEQLVKIFV